MNWKKEYRVSDLFGRGKADKSQEGGPASEQTAEVTAGAGAAEASEPGAGGWPLFGDVGPGAAAQPPSEPPAPAAPGPGARHDEPAVRAEATPPSADAPADPGEPSVWKKEIRFSDLFRRGKKEPGPAPDDAAPEISPQPETSADVESAPAPTAGESGEETEAATVAEPGAEEQSVWKNEIRVSDFVRRSQTDPAEPATEDSPAADAASEEGQGESAAGEAAVEPGPVVEAEAEPEPVAEAETPKPAEEPTAEAPQSEQPVAEHEAAAVAGAVAAVVAHDEADAQESATEDKKPGRLGGLFGGRKEKVEQRPDESETPAAAGTGRAVPRGSNGAGPLPDVPLVRALNLLPREEVKVRTPRPVLRYAGVALLAVLVLGGLGFFYMNERSKIDDRQSAVEDLEAQIAAVQALEQTSPQEGVALAGEALTRASALSTALDGRVVWDRLLRDLSLTLPDDVWFSTVVSTVVAAPAPSEEVAAAVPAAQLVTITGYARTQAGLAQLIARLGVLPELGSLQLQSGNVVELGGEEVVEFSVSAVLKQPVDPTAPAVAPETSTAGEVASS
jgi:Tfp pilus assembly protein PilN